MIFLFPLAVPMMGDYVSWPKKLFSIIPIDSTPLTAKKKQCQQTESHMNHVSNRSEIWVHLNIVYLVAGTPEAPLLAKDVINLIEDRICICLNSFVFFQLCLLQ